MRLRNKKINKKVIILAAILLIITPVLIYFGSLFYKMYFDKMPTFVSAPVIDPSARPADIPDPETSGIDNIVLFGVDNRTPTDHGRTDSIIIATIDKNAQTIKLTSIMRDLYVQLAGNNKSMDRINAAYAIGGPELALKTLNSNFGLDLQYYAIIDFKAFQELVDKMDGIDLDVKDYEVNEINKYIVEVNGSKSTLLKKAGFQHLNGQQALSYARIRHVGDGDYQRTERQRTVLKCLFDKAKQTSILRIPDLITTLVSYVQTNVPLTKVISLGVTAYKFNGGIQQMRIPVDGYFEGQSVYGASVLVPDIKANAMFAKEFIYNIKVSSSKDVPAYMQNDFHMDDGTIIGSKPKPNIPNYNTPDPAKSDDDQEKPIDQGSQTGTNPGDNTGNGTGTGTNNGNGTGTNNGTGTGTSNGTGTGTNGGTGNGTNTGTGTNTDNGTGTNNGGGTGTAPATP